MSVDDILHAMVVTATGSGYSPSPVCPSDGGTARVDTLLRRALSLRRRANLIHDLRRLDDMGLRGLIFARRRWANRVIRKAGFPRRSRAATYGDTEPARMMAQRQITRARDSLRAHTLPPGTRA